jgi:uncharacterized protein
LSPWSTEHFARLFAPPAIGMVHLRALPGSPQWAGDWNQVLSAALTDATALVDGGFRSVMIENFHDVPFYPDRVPAETIAAMTAAIVPIRRKYPDLKLGVNVLRNDATTALGIAAATTADFIRVNVHVGATVTDQGTIQGQAYRTLRLRRELGIEHVGILADVRVKHARPLVERPLADEVRDLRLRGLADGIIVSGAGTGLGADPQELHEVREALPDCPLLVGSGMTAANLPLFGDQADGYIVGTSIQERDPATGTPGISSAKSAEFLKALADHRSGG